MGLMKKSQKTTKSPLDKREYYRMWRKKNPGKNRQYQYNSWKRKILQDMANGEEGGGREKTGRVVHT